MFILLISTGLLAMNCTKSNVKKERVKIYPKWEQEKEEILIDLISIKDELYRKINVIEDKINQAGEDVDEKLLNEKEELEEQMVTLRIKINQLESTIADNWNDFKFEVKEWIEQHFDS